MTILEPNRDNGASESGTLLLGPRESRRLEDVLGVFFGRVEVVGLLEVESGGGALVVAGTQTARTEGEPGTLRTMILPVAVERLGTASALTDSEGRLGRIVVFNPDRSPLAAVVHGFAVDGTMVSETSVVVPPRSSITVESEGAPADRVTVSTEHPHFAFPARVDRIGTRSGDVLPGTRTAR